MKYRLLPNAQKDLQEIDDWVVEQFGLDFADRTQRSLYDTFNLLADFLAWGAYAKVLSRSLCASFT